MKKIALYILGAIILSTGMSACSDNLEIQQNYGFEVTHLPVPKRLKEGETAEIRCQLLRQGYYEGAKYSIRYFQPDGKGELCTEEGVIFQPNDLSELDKESFRLYYTSLCTDQQAIDLYFFDNLGNSFTLSFTFTNETIEVEKKATLQIK